MIKPRLTVGALKAKLADVPDDLFVYIYSEDNENHDRPRDVEVVPCAYNKLPYEQGDWCLPNGNWAPEEADETTPTICLIR